MESENRSDILDDSQDGDGRLRSVRLAKLAVQEAKTAYEHAFAKAYLDAPSRATRLYGVSAAKVPREMVKQIVANDPEVRTLRLALDDAQRALVESELEEEQMAKRQRSGDPLTPLETVFMEDYDADARSVLLVLESEMAIIADNLKKLTNIIDCEKAGITDSEFWRDDLLETACVHKNDLTDYLKVLGSIFRLCPDRPSQSELRAALDYARNLRDDCKTLIDLARLQLRGY